MIVQYVFTNAILGVSLFVIWNAWRREYARAESRAVGIGPGLDPPKELRRAAHDIANLLTCVVSTISAARRATGRDAKVLMTTAETSVLSSREILARLTRRPDAVEVRVSELLGLGVAFIETEVPVQFERLGEFVIDGDPVDAQTVFQNLLANAAREAKLAGGVVRVALDDDGVRVTNCVREGRPMDPDIWQPGVSYSGSTGHGLAIALEAAERLGWDLWNEVEGNAVTFVVRRQGRTDWT